MVSLENSAGQNAAMTDRPKQADEGNGISVDGLLDSLDADCAVHNDSEIDSAAVEVQRMYRGHRARRHIADAATMAHKFGWWDVLDGAVLDYNSTQFYAYSNPQSPSQRWLRLKKKAAKVGKGLSKNENGRKLTLRHWLEAIDPRHRYGHNLHIYYQEWDNCETQEPFFYWLDVGAGKDLDLEHCKRSQLQKELIKYLSPKERQYYEVVVDNGKLKNKMTGQLVNTPHGDKWIFVMSTTGKLYVGKKEKGKLQHSSFLAGGATTAAGRLLVRDGTIEVMEAHSGHYHPTEENFHQLISVLRSSGADLTVANIQFVSDDMLTSSESLNSRRLVQGMEKITHANGVDDSGNVQTEECPNSIIQHKEISVHKIIPLENGIQDKRDGEVEVQ